MKICAVIPAHNERVKIGEVVRRTRKYADLVIVVDDGSNDGTGEAAMKAGAQVVRSESNEGKGAALRRGFAEALKGDWEYIVTMDGDGQHDPENIQTLIAKAQSGDYDLVCGSRMRNVVMMPIVRRWTNRLMSLIVSLLAGINLRDTQCGFRLVSRRILETLNLKESGYNIESELVISAGRMNFRIAEVPIKTIYANEKSKINPIKDTVRFVRFLTEFL